MLRHVRSFQLRQDSNVPNRPLISARHEVEYGSFCLSELEHAKDWMKGIRALPIEREMRFGFEHTLAEAYAKQI